MEAFQKFQDIHISPFLTKLRQLSHIHEKIVTHIVLRKLAFQPKIKV